MNRVCVIIPNLNGEAFLRECLLSLRSQTMQDFDILVIDNGSTDGSRRILREEFPEVRVKRFVRNTGFCHAVNTGIRLSSTPYVILLNNDTCCEPAFVEELVRFMDEHPKAFSAQAKMLRMADPRYLDDAGDCYCALGWAFALGKGEREELYNRRRRIFSACAGAAIYRRAFLERTGLFDERHFAYLEDTDLGWRAQLLGYRNYYAPKARVSHVGSGATGSSHNEFKVRYTSRNSVYLVYKNMPVGQLLLNLPLLLAGFGIKVVFFARKGFGKTYVSGLRSGIRMCRKEDKVPFRLKALPHYLSIQLQLWKGLFYVLKRKA